MKKLCAVFALFCAMFLTISCGNDDDSEFTDNNETNNDKTGNETDAGNTNSVDPGIHLGIIGFNYELHKKEIQLLSNEQDFTNFIDNLERENNTALFYAADNALDMMQAYNKPPKLEHVALITFTDGIDNQSTAPGFKPEYDGPEDYGKDVHKRIVNDKIHGLSVEAYVIGLRTDDEIPDSLLPKFETMLNDLASSGNNAFQVSNMYEVEKHFANIANSLVKESTSINYGVYMPGGYGSGQIRYTFDNAKSAESSELYIEGTYNKKTTTLENIIYHGFAKGATTIKAQQGPKGTLYFQFDNLRYSDGSIASEDMSFTLWQQIDGGDWKSDGEISSEDFPPQTKRDVSSALIMLVLDCTTSLSPDNFNKMQDAAKEFVRTLANAGNNGGGSTSEDVSCTSNDDCNRDSYCDLDNHYCHKRSTCSTQADCPMGWKCKESEGFCITNDEAETVLCKSNDDCKDPAFPKCNLVTGECVADNSDYSDSCPTIDGNMWSSRSFSNMLWHEAVNYCENLYECGYSDWHLPTISELRSLIQNCPATETGGECGVTDNCLSFSECWNENACSSCSSDISGKYSKLGDASYLWSSSFRTDDASVAYYVAFDNGSVHSYSTMVSTSFPLYARCVR